jgi:hypothetical protein
MDWKLILIIGAAYMIAGIVIKKFGTKIGVS